MYAFGHMAENAQEASSPAGGSGHGRGSVSAGPARRRCPGARPETMGQARPASVTAEKSGEASPSPQGQQKNVLPDDSLGAGAEVGLSSARALPAAGLHLAWFWSASGVSVCGTAGAPPSRRPRSAPAGQSATERATH